MYYKLAVMMMLIGATLMSEPRSVHAMQELQRYPVITDRNFRAQVEIPDQTGLYRPKKPIQIPSVSRPNPGERVRLPVQQPIVSRPTPVQRGFINPSQPSRVSRPFPSSRDQRLQDEVLRSNLRDDSLKRSIDLYDQKSKEARREALKQDRLRRSAFYQRDEVIEGILQDQARETIRRNQEILNAVPSVAGPGDVSLSANTRSDVVRRELPSTRETAAVSAFIDQDLRDLRPDDVTRVYSQLIASGQIANAPLSELSDRDISLIKQTAQAESKRSRRGFAGSQTQTSATQGLAGIPGGFQASQGSIGFGGNIKPSRAGTISKGGAQSIGGATRQSAKSVVAPTTRKQSAQKPLNPVLKSIPRTELNKVYADMVRSGELPAVRLTDLQKDDVRRVYNEWRQRDRYDRSSLGR